MLLEYLRRVFEIGQRGEAREESYYSSLEELLLRYATSSGRPRARVTTIPKRAEGSVLDFQVWLGDAAHGVGYIEAKRPGTDLDRAEKSEQVKRYLQTFPNLILTDFHELRLYRGGEEIARARIAPRCMADLLPRSSLDHEPDVVGGEELLALLDLFFSFSRGGTPRGGSAASLAVALAGRARILASRIEELLERDLDGSSALTGYYRAFSEYLIAGLSRGEFADLYAQTIAYGMLAARWQAREAFDRRSAWREIPRANGILRDVFEYISLGDPPPEVRWVLDDLASLLAPAPVREMLRRYFHDSRGRDPILHFYETFLARYNPELRKQRGVYYTPQPLVSYIVRSVHRLLETRLELAGGLAHPGVRLLDPAAGTLTFVIEAMRRAVAEHRRAFGEGGGPALIRDQLRRNFAAFELMMAPYAIGHLKAHLVLEEMGCPLDEGQGIGSFLTDALDGRELEQTPFPGMSSLSRESREAGRWKKEVPDGCAAFVVVGNPPYFGHSSNREEESENLLKLKEGYTAADGRRDEGYYRVDGLPLGEANPRWLQDDYVKFLRFAQWKVDQAGQGVVGFVTNHGYLDNPTFRGMRRSLLGTFDEIYLLDLHGNIKKRERSPDGSADENVFDGVRQGIAIALLVKKPGLPKRVLRADLHGGHGDKLRWLEAHDVDSTPWTPLSPRGPGWLFAPRDVRLDEEYLRGIPLPEIFPVHSVGVVTARDALAVGFTKSELECQIMLFRSSPLPELLAQGFGFRQETGSWNVEEAQRRVRQDEDWKEKFVEILYRPFDGRWVFYADSVIERPREAVMRHMLSGGNLGLIAPRQSKEGLGALVTDRIIGHKAVSAYDINYLFPLYLQPEPGEGLFRRQERVPNLSPALPRFLERLHGESPEPERIFEYVYAVLYSPAYRERYAPLLQGDFPRLPFPRDRRLFEDLAGLGRELIDLHLYRPERLGDPIARISPGSDKVAKRKGARRYDPVAHRVRINEEGQGFDGIPPEVWSYRVGGYQVLDRWLHARAGRRLTSGEMQSFCKTATALQRTIEVQRRIDPLYSAIEPSVGAGIEVGR